MNKGLKIAMLGHKRIPSREGGVEIVVEELSVRMVEKGHHVTCYNRKGHHVSGKQFDNNNMKEFKDVNLKSVLTIDKKGLAAMSSSFFGAICCAFGRYDIVHFHAEGPCAMLWIPKMFGKKCVATIHGIDWQRAKWGGFASKYIKFGEKVAVKYADEIIVLSKNVKKYFEEVYGRKTVYIPNGVNKVNKEEVCEIRKKYFLEKDEYILFLGRIVPEKGVKYLIQAYLNVKTDKKLVIAGGSSDTNEYMKELMQISQKDERIIFTGFVQGKVLGELYSNAYVYVLPSDVEGMPLSLLEAMSYGNCCLVSDIPECVEVVRDKAVIFKKSDVDDIRSKLQHLCNNEDLVKEYKENATDFINTRYNWNKVVSETLKVYRS